MATGPAVNAPDFIPDDQFTPDAPIAPAPAEVNRTPEQTPNFIPDNQFVPDDEKYGTTGQEILTGAEGLAKGLLGPVATAGERYLSSQGIPGLTPEEQAGRQAANPLIHGGAETAGFLAGAGLGTGEAAVVGELGEGAVKAAGLAGENLPLVSQIASSGIKTGAEMAALQAGDEVSKAINQDPSQSIGTAAANIGLAGILGGSGGSVLGAVSPFWKASMEKMGIPKLIDDAKAQYAFRQGLENGGDTAAAITGELNTRLQEMDNLRSQMGDLKGSALADAMPEVTPENVAKVDRQIQDISDTMTQAIEKASDNAYLKGSVPKLAQDLEDFQKVVTDPKATLEDKFNAIDDLKRAQQAKSNYQLTAEDTALGNFTKGIAADLRQKLEDTSVWGKAAEVQQKVNAAIKTSIDAEKDAAGKFSALSNVEGGRVADPTKVNTIVNQSLKGKAGLKTNVIQNYLNSTQDLADTINQIHTDAGLEAPIRLTPTPALDHTLGRSSPGTTLGNWLFDKGLATVGGHVAAEGVGAGLGELIGHPMLGAYFGEKVLSHVFTTIAKPLLESASHGEAFKSSLDFIVNVMKGDKLLSNAAENLFKAGAEIIPKQLMPTVATREKTEKSLEYASNIDNMEKVGGHLSGYMPNHAIAAAQTAAAASQYFAALKPKTLPTGPLDPPGKPDPYAEATYNRQLDIAAQPLLLLKYAKEGTLQPQDMQTVNTVYPGLLPKIASKTYEQMTTAVADGKAIPYRQRVSLSALIGQPLDGTLGAPVMQTILAANGRSGAAQAPMAAGKTHRTSQSTAKAMKEVNETYATPLQARQADRVMG